MCVRLHAQPATKKDGFVSNYQNTPPLVLGVPLLFLYLGVGMSVRVMYLIMRGVANFNYVTLFSNFENNATWRWFLENDLAPSIVNAIAAVNAAGNFFPVPKLKDGVAEAKERVMRRCVR